MDTGSPASFIKKSIVLWKFGEINKFEFSFLWLNNNLKLSFVSVESVFELKLIVEGSVMILACVLGMNFLSEEGLVLTKGRICVESANVSEDYFTEGEKFIRAIMSMKREDTCTMAPRIYEIVSQGVRRTIEGLFLKTYVRPKRPLQPETMCEIKLNLEEARPLSCRPRRLSYVEREKLHFILYNYLRKGYIRPSEFEYALPIVLVKKKAGQQRMCVHYRTLNKITLRDGLG